VSLGSEVTFGRCPDNFHYRTYGKRPSISPNFLSKGHARAKESGSESGSGIREREPGAGSREPGAGSKTPKPHRSALLLLALPSSCTSSCIYHVITLSSFITTTCYMYLQPHHPYPRTGTRLGSTASAKYSTRSVVIRPMSPQKYLLTRIHVYLPVYGLKYMYTRVRTGTYYAATIVISPRDRDLPTGPRGRLLHTRASAPTPPRRTSTSPSTSLTPTSSNRPHEAIRAIMGS
jgi:hypothetical protein